MKKVLLLLLVFCSSFFLSSCKVNWFTTKVDVPWYFIAVPVALILIISYVILMNSTFVCPDCGTEFKPKWYQLSVGIHFMGERIATCPHCGRKGFCPKKR